MGKHVKEDKKKKRVIIISENPNFLHFFRRLLRDRFDEIISGDIKSQDYLAEFLPGKDIITYFVLDTFNDARSLVKALMWEQVRLNTLKIGKENAGSPFIVLGIGEDFLKSPEGKAFRDFPAHHQYIKKPVKLIEFISALEEVTPIDTNSLCVINRVVPTSILEALEHDLKSISKKFNYSGKTEDIQNKLDHVMADLNNYELYQADEKKILKLKKAIEKLKREIVKRRGDVWKKKY